MVLVAALMLGLVAMLASAVAQAATIIVNSTADDNAGHCTLREAINSANGASSGTGTCTAGDGDDTIEFSVSGTIMLTSTLPGCCGR